MFATPRHDIPGDNPDLARLSEMVIALLGELCVVTERLDTVERLLERSQVVKRADIEALAGNSSAVDAFC